MRNLLPRFSWTVALLVLTTLLAASVAAPHPATASGTGTSVTVEADGTRVETTCTSKGVCTHFGLQPPTATRSGHKAARATENGNRTQSTSGPTAAAAGGWPTDNYWMLQMNLCNSGLAPCYERNQGRSVPEAQQMIRNQTADVVTVNEICRSDMPALISAMRELHPGDALAWVFQAAIDDRTNGPAKCANAEDYGVGVLGRVPPEHYAGATDWAGRYPQQSPDPDNHEDRVYACLIMIGNYWACTTHLDNSDADTAYAQCHYLMDNALPLMRSAYPPLLPTMVGGDFNLGYSDMEGCVPGGWERADDLQVQNLMVTDNDLEFLSVGPFDMQYTDHPALVAEISRK